MSLHDDWNELASLWTKGSWVVRATAVASLFFAISSIASLADIVFAWKGFILDGIEFYRAWITEPIRRLASLVGLSYSQNIADIAVLVSLTFVSVARNTILDTFDLKDWKNVAASVLSVFCLIGMYVVLGMGELSSNQKSIFILVLVSIYFLWGIVYWIFLGKISGIRYFAPGIIGCMSVLILAAINSGLARVN